MSLSLYGWCIIYEECSMLFEECVLMRSVCCLIEMSVPRFRL